jgi:hypothetical protein
MVFFTQRRDFDELSSSDQNFGGNRLFYGDKGAVAMTFFAP